MSLDVTYRREAMRIGGEKVGAGRSGERAIDVFNPFTGKRIGSVPKASLDEVRRALAIAHGYRATLSRYERANILDSAAARVRERTAEYRRLYAQRQGIESTMSQGVRAFGLRQARYRGLVKPGCSMSPPPRPSTSTASRPGSPSALSRPPAPHASPPSRRSRRLRQRCPRV